MNIAAGPRLSNDRSEPLGMGEVPHAPRSAPKPFMPKVERLSQWRNAADLEGQTIPTKEWLVPDLIPKRCVTLLFGDGGTGKSLLALQLAASVATGGDWIGHKLEQGRAVFFSAEDEDDDLHRRLSEIVGYLGCRFANLGGLTFRSLVGEDATLAQTESLGKPLVPTDLYHEIDGLLRDQKPDLIVLDTLADLFAGNENAKTEARQFMGFLKELAFRHSCAVVVLAHPSRAGMATGSGDSGSVSWGNSARSRLYFERIIGSDGREENPNARLLRVMKANHGPKGAEFGVIWSAGVFTVNAQESGLDATARNAKAQRVFLKLLSAFSAQGRRVNHAGSSTYAPKVFAEHPDSEGVSKRGFKTAMDSLLAAGLVTIQSGGPPSRVVTYLKEREQV